MEGIKKQFSAQIDDSGTLRMVMNEVREFVRHHPNQKAVVTIEVLNGGDCIMMKTWYNNYALPRIVEAWRELGESYTVEQADRELVKHTTVRRKTVLEEDWIIDFDELDRDLRKRYLDEVALFCSINLNLDLT